ncbi:MAG: glycerol-3-phosphate dehydrogenase/oxidase [Bacteroidetes bacterium]|nr:glycerol-3-phosphate dehydrogenase/oxidase [Bacteroidota bacterium]
MIPSRDELLKKAVSTKRWDIIIIGGGATGLGVAVDAATRGYTTLLVEARDFGKGTSSKSTKLIHGGVRYLRQGNIKMVMKALRERGRLLNNAPHIVHPLRFVVPCYRWWHKPWYGIGLKLYDALARNLGIAPSKILNREETLSYVPGINPVGLRGGVEYWDGQFDDARLLVSLAQTAVLNQAIVLNYVEVVDLVKTKGLVTGVRVRDVESGTTFELEAQSVINATGIETDFVRRMDNVAAAPMMQAAQGIHVVVDSSFLSTDTAIMIPDTDDGRVLFGVPWHGKLLVGTTDTPREEISKEPEPLEVEIDYLISHIARYLSKPFTRKDVLSVFAGLRPLVRANKAETKSISRDHTLEVSASGLVTITGGKWTTYRQMAEDAINRAERALGRPRRPSITRTLALSDRTSSDATSGSGSKQIHPDLPYTEDDVRRAVTDEWARSVEDVLARRTRSLFLNAAVAMEVAPKVANLMANELGWDENRQQSEVKGFLQVAKIYSVHHI